MKAILLLVARLLFVAVYSIAVGLFTGFLFMKLDKYFDKRSRARWDRANTYGTEAENQAA